MKKIADFIHTNLLKIPDALKNFLKKLHAVLKTLTMKYLRKLHADHKPLIEKYLVRLLFTQHRHCPSQRLKWILVRGHVNLVGSRNVLGYITTKATTIFTICFIVDWKRFDLFFFQKQQMRGWGWGWKGEWFCRQTGKSQKWFWSFDRSGTKVIIIKPYYIWQQHLLTAHLILPVAIYLLWKVLMQ